MSEEKIACSGSTLRSQSCESTLANSRFLAGNATLAPPISIRSGSSGKMGKSTGRASTSGNWKTSTQPAPAMPRLKLGNEFMDHKVWDTADMPNTKSTGASERVKEIESGMTTSCARHIPEPQRSQGMTKALEDIGRVYPPLTGALLVTRRYIKELVSSLASVQESHVQEIKRLEETVYKKYESFFEDKILQLMRENRKSESLVKQLREEVFMLRKEREEELMNTKEIVMTRLNDCERKEDEFKMLKRLVALVFKTNQGLVNQVEDLSSLLRKHRIDVPKIDDALFLYSKPKTSGSSGSADNTVKKITEQVSPQFIEASRREMSNSRLTLQRELLNNAFDDCSAYRLQINGLRSNNCNLQFQVSSLQSQIVDLERYIHEKRFLRTVDDGSEGVPLTPRPRNIPFAIQADLGVDLKKSTEGVLSELTAVALNLKHQLNSSVLILRRLASAMEWIDGESLLRGPEDREGWGLIPVFPPSVWNEIPHFLRTNLAGDVPNLNWSGEDVAALLYEFFSRYDALRDACRTVRDSRMFVPRVYQLFERIEHSLVRLDATVSETLESVENVPFGYVVSFFISNFLRSHTSASPHRNLLQPGTVISVYSTSSSTSPVEMEFTKMSYNLWYASHRHKSSQPLCYLFVNVLEGRLPLQIFGLMTSVLRNVENTISKSDTEGSNLFSYNKLVSIVLKLVGDMDAQVGRCAVLAVAEMFKANDLPLMGGKINTYDISADEATLASTERRLTNRSPVRHAHHSKSDSSFGQAFKGASVLTCFWRRLVIRSHERVYDIMESILGPMVLESQVVVGLFVLPIGSSMAALRAFDDNKLTPSREYLQSACPFMRERARSRCTSPSGSDAPQLRPTAVHFNMDRVERTAFIQSIKDISFSDVFSEVLKKVHLIGTNIHFPNDGVEELQPSSLTTDVGVEKTARSRSSSPKKRPRRTKKGGVVNQKKVKEKSPRKNVADATPRSVDMASEKVEELVPMNLVVKSDKELVEWYNFCAVLRQTQLNFSSSIFHNES